jgi:hypothetical protein
MDTDGNTALLGQGLAASLSQRTFRPEIGGEPPQLVRPHREEGHARSVWQRYHSGHPLP